MDKPTQTIGRQIADELFECVWPLCEIGAKRVNKTIFKGGMDISTWYKKRNIVHKHQFLSLRYLLIISYHEFIN